MAKHELKKTEASADDADARARGIEQQMTDDCEAQSSRRFVDRANRRE